MFSIDLGNVDLRIVLAIVVVAFVLKITDTVTSRLLWRDGTIKDMQILSALKDLGEDALYSEYRKSVQKRILDKVHGYNAAALTLGILVRSVPGIAIALMAFFINLIYAIAASSVEISEVPGSLASYLLAGLVIEGFLAMVRPFVKPLSGRSKSRKAAEASVKSSSEDPSDGKKADGQPDAVDG